MQTFYGKQSKSSETEQQQEQRHFWSKWKRIEENLMKKPTCKQTRLFEAKMFQWNGTTGHIEHSSHGKSLAGKDIRWAMKIESWHGTAGCRRGSAAEEKVRKHRDHVTGAWKQISRQIRRVDVSYDPSMVAALSDMVHKWMKRDSKRLTSKRR